MSVTYDSFLEQITLLTVDIETTGINYDAIAVNNPRLVGENGTQSFWPSTKDAAKKMLMTRNPDITKEQADMIFDSEKELNDKEEAREERRRRKEEERALSREERQALSTAEKEKKRKDREDRRQKRKEQRQKRIKAYKETYKKKIEEWKKEAKENLRAIKDGLLQIWNGFLDIVKRLVKTIIQTASGIVGIIQIIIAPPYNVPNAIKQTMDLIESYLNILKAIKDLNPYFRIFQIMPIFIDKTRLKILAKIFQPIVQGLRKFFVPIQKFNKLLTDLFKWLSNFLNRNRESIFRRATKKLKKLGHLYRPWFIHPQMKGKISIVGIEIPNPFFPGKIRGDFYPTNSEREYPCYAFEDEDIDEIQGLLDTFEVGFEDDKERNAVVRYRRKYSEDAKDLSLASGFDFGQEIDFDSFDFESIANDFDNIPETEIEVEDEDGFIYDIELPDGTIVRNVSEAGIEFYQQNYILKYLNAVSQAVKDATSV